MRRKNAVLYTRWPKRRRRIHHQENSLEGQKSELLDYCNKNNIDVIAYIEDELTSSNPFRDKWMELERFVYEHSEEVDEVVMVCHSRCSSKLGITIDKLKWLRSLGVELTYTRGDNNDMARMELMFN